jgi:predicted AlkP superfamily pyrophosphatase or phosphodiesterase
MRMMRGWGRVFGLALGLMVAGVGLLAQTTVVAQTVPAQATAAQNSALPVIHIDNGPNSAAAQKAHYVVLVSLDGFRWDYAKRDGAKNLLAIAKQGAWAPQGMIPSYPSLTFPNHYTLATGLYPEHSGLVANSFEDPVTHAKYGMSDAKAVTDGSWYNGVPLWSLAESEGMRSACFFWPGSEAKIAGFQPTYYLKFDDKIDEHARIAQVLAWLKLPEADRPHLITLYYSHPDHEGHEFGPDAKATSAMVRHVDELVGELKSGLNASGLPVDLIVVSDHGMVRVAPEWVTLDKFADLTGVETAGGQIYPKDEAEKERIYNQLKKASDKFVVYRLKDVPAGLHYNENAREGDPVVVPTGAYAIRVHGLSAEKIAAGQVDKPPIPGMHGFDPRTMPEMKASFFAEGPDFVKGKTLAPFENVNVYPLIAHILGLKAPKTDGSLSVLSAALKDHGFEAEVTATDGK